MAGPSVTYTFTNGTTADGTQVSQNFTDLINGLTDGTKDLNINALTAAGTATLNGNIILGNAIGDTVTVNGVFAGTGGYASPTQMGIVSTGAQSYAGVKTFTNGINLGNDDLTIYNVDTWTPTVSSQSGTITSYTLSYSRYTQIGAVIFITVRILITNKGTAAGQLYISTPSGLTCAVTAAPLSSQETQSVGIALNASAESGGARISVLKLDGSTAIVDNYGITVNGMYPV
jgi:hypothetical protein